MTVVVALMSFNLQIHRCCIHSVSFCHHVSGFARVLITAVESSLLILNWLHQKFSSFFSIKMSFTVPLKEADRKSVV